MQNKLRLIKDILWFFVFWAFIVAIFRMWFGLGATTNLSDELPWGLWKILNMIAGVALSTCGFTIGFLVYVLKIEKFKPLLRPAILIAFLGYGSSCAALMFDIGLPQNFWHPFVMWNEHSFLFEVFWCVIIYFTVTFIELVPNILEKFNKPKIVHFLHKIAIGVVILGISLSSLHHSSLGSLFLTTPLRLHELWYTPMIPWMFIISAMGGGMMFLILLKILYARFYDPVSVFGVEYLHKSSMVCAINGNSLPKVKKQYGKDMDMLSKLSIIAASLMGLYLLFKLYDLFASGSVNALMAGTWESWLFSVELILTAILPILLVLIPRARRSPYGLGIAAFSASIGVALNRVDVGIFGYFSDAGVIYWPSIGEWALSIGVFAAAGLAFFYISENFSIFDNKEFKGHVGIFSRAFDSFSRVWTTTLQDGVYRISLIAVFIIPIAFVVLYPNYQSKDTQAVQPAKGIDETRSTLMINGNDNDIFTEFPHDAHKQRLGEEQSCMQCHHMSVPEDNSTPCARCHSNMLETTDIFNHSAHMGYVAESENLSGLHPENKSCNKCHVAGDARTEFNAKSCIKCHSEDMKINPADQLTVFKTADSYMDAMHKKCITCHESNSQVQGLGDCQTCHKDLNVNRSDVKKMMQKK